MDVVWLSRLQFAVATMFHFLFVPLTLGLSVLLAIMETKYVRTGDEEYKRLTQFFGKIFLVNFAVGVVTGITLEFQFGTNWSQYSKQVGDIFGSLLAIEATTSFFLESTFVAIWLFSWNILSPRLHLMCIWLVAIAGNLSAFWILVANSWMQHPVGYVINQGRAELSSFWEVVTNPFAILTFLHVVIAGCIVGGFFVMGVSAYHLLKKNHLSMFRKSFRLALIFSLVFSVSELAIGDFHGKEVAQKQPAKVAALESIWETASGVPFAILTLPDEKNERNYFEALKIPKFASFLLYGDWNAEIKGLKDFPRDERPPVLLTFVSFRLMVGLGFLFALWTVIGFFLRHKIEENRWYLWVTLFMIPLPYLASELGWIVTEVGRQPWIVYGMMKTSEAVSPIVSSQVAISLVAFIVLYTLLGFAAFFLMFDIARKGPNVPLPGEKLAQQER